MMRSAIAAGLTVRGIKVDPVTGEYTVLIGKPDPARGEPDTTKPDDAHNEWDAVR